MKKAILVFLLGTVFCNGSVLAEGWTGEVGYMNVGDSDIDLGALYGIVGYEVDHSDSYSSTLELLVGFGVQDDSLTVLDTKVDIELDSAFGLGYKGTFNIDDAWSVYYRAMYAQMDLSADVLGISVGVDESDFGAGVGVTFKHVTVGYLKFFGDLDVDAISIAYKF
jgi:hypothetical protein